MDACCNPLHLSWKTPKENQADKVVHGTNGGHKGEENWKAILSEADVLKIRAMPMPINISHVARSFGVSRQCIGDVIYRKRWRHI
jgi:hypothetical protein